MGLDGQKAKAAVLSDRHIDEILPGNMLQSAKCRIVGWGNTDPRTYKQSSVVLSAPVDIIPSGFCTNSTDRTYRKFNSPTQFCAGRKGFDSCVGDSGGPLYCEVNQQWVLFGLTSYGPDKCGNIGGDTPGVYMNVAHLLTFIQQHVTGKSF